MLHTPVQHMVRPNTIPFAVLWVSGALGRPFHERAVAEQLHKYSYLD
jgi:hypothetical protein